MITILHGSDIHFGEPHVPRAARAFVEAARATDPDAIVLSGDLTQRAKASEFKEVRRYLDGLPDVPVIVTAGNHDVPVYRGWERLLWPFRNYLRYVAPELDTVTSIPGATLVALCSAAPHTAIVNGKITPQQLGFARRAFSTAPSEDLRIAVMHHNLVAAPDDYADPVLPRSRAILKTLYEMGVALILGGHLHRGFVVTWPPARQDGVRKRPMHIVMSGTTSSTRGRAAEIGKQSYNLLHLSHSAWAVTRYLSDDGGETFEAAETHDLERSDLFDADAPTEQPEERPSEQPASGRSAP